MKYPEVAILWTAGAATNPLPQFLGDLNDLTGWSAKWASICTEAQNLEQGGKSPNSLSANLGIALS